MFFIKYFWVGGGALSGLGMAGYGGYYAWNKYHKNNKKEQFIANDEYSSKSDQKPGNKTTDAEIDSSSEIQENSDLNNEDTSKKAETPSSPITDNNGESSDEVSVTSKKP